MGSIDFVDDRLGWTLGGREPLETTDAGKTWAKRSAGGMVPSQLAFADRDHGWIVGSDERGLVALSTVDGGRHWSSWRVFGGRAATWALDFVDSQSGWLAGAATPGKFERALLATTSNGGHVWHRLAVRAAEVVLGLRFISPRLGWIAVQGPRGGEIRATRDGGRSWATVTASISVGAGPITVWGGRVLWMVGPRGLYSAAVPP
ncbi:MAG: hypothetical protein JOZ41_22960 [Chloroflexi bacterium]|nr:hypothetical protein [Chloroflexota bacterium]